MKFEEGANSQRSHRGSSWCDLERRGGGGDSTERDGLASLKRRSTAPKSAFLSDRPGRESGRGLRTGSGSGRRGSAASRLGSVSEDEGGSEEVPDSQRSSSVSCVSWHRTEGPRQLALNRRAASAGIEPEGRVFWNGTGGPRQLASNRRAASAGIEPEGRVSWYQTAGRHSLPELQSYVPQRSNDCA